MSALGRELARQRTATGISMARLGRRAGYDHSHISRLESGGTATVECLHRLSGVLGTPPGGRTRSFAGLLNAWLSDHGVPCFAAGDAFDLVALIPQLPEGDRNDVTAALGDLREWAQGVIDQMRLADDGCPNHKGSE